MVKTGIELLVASPPDWIQGKRLGLLCNQGSTDRYLRHSRDLIDAALPGQLKCLEVTALDPADDGAEVDSAQLGDVTGGERALVDVDSHSSPSSVLAGRM